MLEFARMRSRPIYRAACAGLVAAAALGSGCGRLGLVTRRSSRPDFDAALLSDSSSRPSGDAGTHPGGSIPREAASVPMRESGSSDAQADARAVRTHDAAPEDNDGNARADTAPDRDAPAGPDCRCAP